MVNDLIRQALFPYPENLKLVTNVGARRDDAGGVHAAQSPDKLRNGVEANLRSLRVERLDLVNLRLVETSNDTAIALEEQLGALEDLRQEGKLDLIGLSNVDQPKMQHAPEFVDVAEIQNAYNIIERQDDDLIEFASEQRSPSYRSSPSARRSRVGQPDWPQTRGSFRSPTSGATPSQIALGWLLARYERMLLIPGTSTVAHLEENMAAIEIELDDGDLAALEHVK